VGAQTLVTDWAPADHGRHTLLSACLRDGPGVLARLAGTLSGAGFDILAVEAFTRADGIVVDVFTLAEAGGMPTAGPERWAAVDADLRAALEGRYDVDAAVAARWARLPWARRRRPGTVPAVRFEPPDALGRTVIEVRADDRPGLVYRITACLTRLGLDISFAKIATEKSRALDVFYVTTARGEPVPAAQAAGVEAELIAALTRPD
jgi:[protein-PII] uridylyltransferase